MKTVALVPIKLNSQRLPRKNLLPLLGKPMCWHILNTLHEVEGIDEVYAYCSDDAIQQYIPEGVRHLKRDVKLDGDLVKGFEIYDAFIGQVDADVYVLAHTTSPFLKKDSVANALGHILAGSHDSAFTAQRIQTFAWYKGEPINYDVNDVPRTQDIEPVYVETSGFYMFQKEIFTKHRRRVGFTPFIQQVDDMEALDIDEQKDYDMALRLAGE